MPRVGWGKQAWMYSFLFVLIWDPDVTKCFLALPLCLPYKNESNLELVSSASISPINLFNVKIFYHNRDGNRKISSNQQDIFVKKSVFKISTPTFVAGCPLGRKD